MDHAWVIEDGSNHTVSQVDQIEMKLVWSSMKFIYFQNYIQEIRRLAKFLDLDTDEALIQEIAEKCRFKHMAVDKEYSKDFKARAFKNNFTMYRKGNN